jgi:hypothetical protein
LDAMRIVCALRTVCWKARAERRLPTYPRHDLTYETWIILRSVGISSHAFR